MFDAITLLKFITCVNEHTLIENISIFQFYDVVIHEFSLMFKDI